MLAPARLHHLAGHGRRLLALAALACIPLAGCGSDGSATTVSSQDATAGNVTDTTTPDTTTPDTTPESTPATTSPETAPATAAIATVVYEFHDASVPPEYHRSYTVTVTDGTATVVVDSYGDVIAQDSQPIDEAMWTVTADAAAVLAGTESTEHTGCTGGTAEEVTALDARGAEVVHVILDHCGEAGGQDLSTVVASVLPLFDLATMTATS